MIHAEDRKTSGATTKTGHPASLAPGICAAFLITICVVCLTTRSVAQTLSDYRIINYEYNYKVVARGGGKNGLGICSKWLTKDKRLSGFTVLGSLFGPWSPTPHPDYDSGLPDIWRQRSVTEMHAGSCNCLIRQTLILVPRVQSFRLRLVQL